MKKLLTAALIAGFVSTASAGEKNRPKLQESGYGVGIYRLAVTPVDVISKPWCYYCPTREVFGAGMRGGIYPAENGMFADADLIRIKKFDPLEDFTVVEYRVPFYAGYQHAVGNSPLKIMFGAGLTNNKEYYYDYTERKLRTDMTFRPAFRTGVKASIQISDRSRGFVPRSVDVEVSGAYFRYKFRGSDNKIHDGGHKFLQMNIGATFRRNR